MKRTLLFVIAFFAITFGSYAQWLIQNTGFTTQYRGISYISIVNSNVVWAIAYDGSGGGQTINEFTRTTDGGTTWIPGSVLGGTTYGLGNISAIDGTTAWVALYNKGTQDNTCGVYKTTDAGVTWTHQPNVLVGSAAFADNVHFWNANEGMAHGDVNGGYFEIWTTSDGGDSWTRVPQSDITGTVVSGEGGWTSVFQAIGDSTCMFGSNKGKLYISHDRGHHWIARTTGIVPATNGGVQHIAFVDPMNGLVAQDKNPGTTTDTTLQIYKTSDGGVTWSQVTTSGWVFSNCLAPVVGSTGTYVTAGANTGGTPPIYTYGCSYSFDGGTTYSMMDAFYNNQFLYTSFINDSTGWSGHFNNSSTDDGIYKFIDVLAPPVADFMSPDTLITFGGQVHFTNLSQNKPTSYNWTFQGGSPASSTLKTPPAITYIAFGDYDVTLNVVSDFGSNTIVKPDYIHVWPVGINDISKASITMYPNPVTDYININSTVNIKEVQVINLIGQVVLSQRFDTKTVTLNTTGLKSGVYNLKVKLENGIVNKKIVVN
ncbi:MAG: T9SS type A sorting domain-containing protein [Bacteroidetes bacterium]|nr:T9SS type A sorting domain-containing protein [Bacteroidota bacterium]